MEFSTSNTNISNSDISGCHLTPDSTITVTDGGGNTYVGTNFDMGSGGYFIGFGLPLPVANGTWTGAAANGTLTDDGNWSLGNPSTSSSYTGIIPASLSSYPSNGTAACNFTLDSGSTINGGTYTGTITDNGCTWTITGTLNITGTLASNVTISGAGNITGGTYSGLVTIPYGTIPTATFTGKINLTGATGYSGIKQLQFGDSIVFTKEKGINGSGILGVI